MNNPCDEHTDYSSIFYFPLYETIAAHDFSTPSAASTGSGGSGAGEGPPASTPAEPVPSPR